MTIKKYKQAAASIAFLTLILTSGVYPYGVHEVRAAVPKVGRNTAYQEQILSTFEEGDYLAWKSAVNQDSSISRVVSKSDFAQFVEARELVRSGRYDEALVLTNSLSERLKARLN